jgi:hypothetical protein
VTIEYRAIGHDYTTTRSDMSATAEYCLDMLTFHRLFFALWGRK